MADKGMRWVYVRVKHLPTGAALWRAQESEPPPEEPTSEPMQIDTSDPNAIDAFFNQLAG